MYVRMYVSGVEIIFLSMSVEALLRMLFLACAAKLGRRAHSLAEKTALHELLSQFRT